MEHATEFSGAAAFDRSNGFLPIKELGDVVVSLNALGRALFSSYDHYIRNVRENAPETEREVVRLHISFLNSCVDVVKGRLAELDKAAEASTGGLEPVQPTASAKIPVE